MSKSELSDLENAAWSRQRGWEFSTEAGSRMVLPVILDKSDPVIRELGYVQRLARISGKMILPSSAHSEQIYVYKPSLLSDTISRIGTCLSPDDLCAPGLTLSLMPRDFIRRSIGEIALRILGRMPDYSLIHDLLYMQGFYENGERSKTCLIPDASPREIRKLLS